MLAKQHALVVAIILIEHTRRQDLFQQVTNALSVFLVLSVPTQLS